MLVPDQPLPQSGFIYRGNLYHTNKSPWPREWTQSNVIACKAQPDKIWVNLNIYLIQWSRLSQTCSWIRRKKGCNLTDTGSYRVGMGTSIGRDNLSFYLLKCFILKGECGTTHNAPAGRSAWRDLEYSHWCFRCIGCWHWSLQPLSLLAQGCNNASSLQVPTSAPPPTPLSQAAVRGGLMDTVKKNFHCALEKKKEKHKLPCVPKCIRPLAKCNCLQFPT